VQCLRELVQCSERQVFFSSFDRSHISPVEIASRREFLLGPTSRFAELADYRRDVLHRR
jgi:hypothetical protein